MLNPSILCDMARILQNLPGLEAKSVPSSLPSTANKEHGEAHMLILPYAVDTDDFWGEQSGLG